MRRLGLLIIDDDPTQHEVLGEYLEAAGYAVRHAHDGEAGLAQVAAEPPDGVLLDLEMPRLDGFGVLARLQADPRSRDVPVLMVTSHDQAHLKIKGLELGAEDYVTKPFERSVLLARIRAALRRSRRYRQVTGALAGDLRDLGLATVLQTVELSGRPGRVELPDLDGEVAVHGGRLLHARFGAQTGTAALQRLLWLDRGAFRVEVAPAGQDPPADLGQPLAPALMAALADSDEILRDLASVAPVDAAVEIGTGASARLAALAGRGPWRLGDLVAALDGPLRSAADEVVAALQSGAVRVLPTPGEE
jgi:CheY-like chemotaxis protein